MDNKEIVSNLRTLASFLELHGENEFKIKGYNNAIYNIERITDPLEAMSLKELENVNGIGKSIAAKIFELLQNEKIAVLEDLISKTPEGVVEMMNIKGLGTKKIRTLWQELDIISVDQLQSAIKKGLISNLKGFGGKVLENIDHATQFYLQSKSKTHYSKAEAFYLEIESLIMTKYPDIQISPTGELRRRMEVISKISLVVGRGNFNEIHQLVSTGSNFVESEGASPFTLRGTFKDCPVPIEIFLCDPDKFFLTLFITTGSNSHLAFQTQQSTNLRQLTFGLEVKSEADIYTHAGLPYIDPELREGLFEFQFAKSDHLPTLIKMEDLKGVIHSHSHYSDGKHSLREMAEYCKSSGYEYLGISDHSKAAAFYANGMDEDRVKKQQEEIDRLNEELAPFKIFKGIEADILADGSLDYDPETLASFDFVVASVHSVLNMDLEKAMDRMMKAIRNPFTTILGHLTGRQLLIRDGYPLDHKAIIDACAEYNVIIEINAHPYRLDMDWRWIPYALEKKVMLSINPDAHAIDGFRDMYYGVCVARKGGLNPESTFNTKSMQELEVYFQNRKLSVGRLTDSK